MQQTKISTPRHLGLLNASLKIREWAKIGRLNQPAALCFGHLESEFLELKEALTIADPEQITKEAIDVFWTATRLMQAERTNLNRGVFQKFETEYERYVHKEIDEKSLLHFAENFFCSNDSISGLFGLQEYAFLSFAIWDYLEALIIDFDFSDIFERVYASNMSKYMTTYPDQLPPEGFCVVVTTYKGQDYFHFKNHKENKVGKGLAYMPTNFKGINFNNVKKC